MCVIQDYIQNETDSLWVSWDDNRLAIHLSVSNNKLCFKRPDGRPGQRVTVQVFAFSRPITDVAFYTFLEKGIIKSMFNLKK